MCVPIPTGSGEEGSPKRKCIKNRDVRTNSHKGKNILMVSGEAVGVLFFFFFFCYKKCMGLSQQNTCIQFHLPEVVFIKRGVPLGLGQKTEAEWCKTGWIFGIKTPRKQNRVYNAHLHDTMLPQQRLSYCAGLVTQPECVCAGWGVCSETVVWKTSSAQ